MFISEGATYEEHVLREIIKISDQEFLRIMELIRKTDEQIGKYLIGKNKLLFNVSLYSFYPLLFKELVDFTDKQMTLFFIADIIQVGCLF